MATRTASGTTLATSTASFSPGLPRPRRLSGSPRLLASASFASPSPARWPSRWSTCGGCSVASVAAEAGSHEMGSGQTMGDDDESVARVDAARRIEAALASPVRSRLLVSTLQYSVEQTMREWRDGGARPASGNALRRWLNERLGRNLYVGDVPDAGGYVRGTGTGGKVSPGGMLLSTLDWDRGGGGGKGEGEDGPTGGGSGGSTWTGRDLASARNHLRALLQRRLDVRCAALGHHGFCVVTGVGPGRVDTNLVVSGRARAAGVGENREPPVLDLTALLALDDEGFARHVAAAHAKYRSELTFEAYVPDAVTADDVLRTMSNVKNVPGGVSTVASTYDVAFMSDRFADDALP